jgi:hypothetical protein
MTKVFLKSIQILVVLSLICTMGCKKDKLGGGDVNNQPPTCSIVNPIEGAAFNIDENVNVIVAAVDTDGTIAEVQLYVDDKSHSIKKEMPYTFTINVGEMTVGAHALKAVAKDNKGAKTEATVNIIINPTGTNKPPTCSITNPAEETHFKENENIPVIVVAEDEDGYIVQVHLYVDNVGHSGKNEFPYNFTINARELSIGAHALKVIAIDNQGAKAEATVNIIVDEVPPPPNYVIEAYDVKLTEGAGIANVKGYMEGDNEGSILATAKFSGNGFKLEVPETVQDKYLDDWGGPIMGELWIIATDSGGNEIGECYKYGMSEGEAYWAGWYYYVKADYKDDYITLKKGWNQIFWIWDWDWNDYAVTTDEPAGTVWIFDDGSKKSGNQAIYQKLQNLKKRKNLK